MPSLDRIRASTSSTICSAAICAARWPRPVREDGIWVERDGKRLLSFSCNDYLNLTQHPAIKQAAMAAIERYGAGSGASRLVTGNHPLYAAAGSAACPHQADRSGGRVRLRLSRQCRHHPGADRPRRAGAGSTNCRTPACSPARNCRAARVLTFRHNDVAPCARTAGRASRRARPRADRHRRRVLHGRRSGAARRAAGARQRTRRLADVGRRPRAGRGRRRTRLELSSATRIFRFRCRWARCRKRSAPMAAISAPRSR